MKEKKMADLAKEAVICVYLKNENPKFYGSIILRLKVGQKGRYKIFKAGGGGES